MIRRVLQNAVSHVPWRMRGMVKHVPLVAPFQRWLVSKFLARDEFVHRVDAGPARGLVYPVRLPQDKGVWIGTYETGFARAVANAVAAGDVCFDVGGGHAFYGGGVGVPARAQARRFRPLPA